MSDDEGEIPSEISTSIRSARARRRAAFSQGVGRNAEPARTLDRACVFMADASLRRRQMGQRLVVEGVLWPWPSCSALWPALPVPVPVVVLSSSGSGVVGDALLRLGDPRSTVSV